MHASVPIRRKATLEHPSARLSSYAREQLRRAANHATLMIAKAAGRDLGMVIISGYPKSGTSWLSYMVSDYLGLPRPDRYLLPIAMPSVIHSHARYSRRLRPAVYIYRDGRDVMVSYYFFRMARLDSQDEPAFARSMRRRYAEILGPGFDPADVRRNLPAFIRAEMRHSRGSRVNWPTHVREWLLPRRPGVSYVSYERLVTDPVVAMKETIRDMSMGVPNEERIDEVVRRHEFSRASGKVGLEDVARKGIAGDWRNHFSRRAGETFCEFAGEELVALGYEADNSWLDRLSE